MKINFFMQFYFLTQSVIQSILDLRKRPVGEQKGIFMEATLLLTEKYLISGTYVELKHEFVHDIEFIGDHFTGGSYQQNEFDSVLFLDCEFQATTFESTIFIGCRFVNCNFSFSKFENCKFIACTFENCIFTLTNSLACHFQACTFSHNSWKLGATTHSKICDSKLCAETSEHFLGALDSLSYPTMMSHDFPLVAA